MRAPLLEDLFKSGLDGNIAYGNSRHAAKAVTQASPILGEHAISEQIAVDLRHVIPLRGFPSHHCTLSV
jgi:hypothetical protein